MFGGITAGIVALPLALAFGLQSGLGAEAGLFGAIFVSFFAAMFGGTQTQISGPTAPMTAVSMIVVADIIAANGGNLDVALPSILSVFVLAGLMQIVLGVLKFGQYIRYIPYPVVSGFMTGIGVIILVTQMLPLLGYYPKENVEYVAEFMPRAEEVLLEKILREEAAEGILVLDNFKETVRRAAEIEHADIMREASVLAANQASGVTGSLRLLGRAIPNINLIDFILGLCTIAIIYGFRRISSAVPSTLVALLSVTLAAWLFIPDYHTIGVIPGGFPVLHLDVLSGFRFEHIRPHVLTAASLAGLGAIDSLLTSIVADNLTKTKHDSNQELIGQGIGNSVAGLFGGIPGAGATIRTVVNIRSGARTKLSGMVSGGLLLVVLLMLGPLASRIPAAVLAGILITVGIGVMDYKGLKHIRHLPRAEVAVMLSVLMLTVFVGLIEAVLVGLTMACIIFMKNIADVVANRTKTAPLLEFSHELPWVDEGNIIQRVGNRVYIKHLNGPLFFGFASRLQDMFDAIPDLRVVIIRMDQVPYVDQSGLYAMEDAIRNLQARGIWVAFTDIHGQPKTLFERFKLIPGLVDRDHCFENFASCSEWLERYLAEESANGSNFGEQC